MKILIIQTAFIGDVILATPIIEKLNAFYPNANIDFLLRKGNESLLNNSPKLNKIWVYDKKNEKYKNLFELIKEIRRVRFDLVVNVQRHFTTGLITCLSNAKFTIGFQSNPLSFLFSKRISHSINKENVSLHDVDRNISLIAHLTDNKRVLPKLYPTDKDRVKVQFKGEYICIAPSSVWFTKQLPLSKWVELIQLIPVETRIFLLGGKDDLLLCNQIKLDSKHPNVEVMAGNLSLLESAALIEGSNMNYVNDSAPMHIASAMNAPVTAFFCSTVPAFGFGPLSDKSIIAESKELLTCRPCGLHGKKSCPLKHFKCTDIDVTKLV